MSLSRTQVSKKLEDGLSPEQISGRFQLEGRPVGRQQIYNFGNYPATPAPINSP